MLFAGKNTGLLLYIAESEWKEQYDRNSNKNIWNEESKTSRVNYNAVFLKNIDIYKEVEMWITEKN